MAEKEPLQVRVFVCHNALAGGLQRSGLQEIGVGDSCYLEQIPCLGKIDPRYLLKAFEGGCDAVCLIGCPPGKCRTMDGNLRAQRRVVFVRGLLDEIGIKGERLFLYLTEPMDAERIRDVLREFLEAVRGLGRSELKGGKDTQAP